MQRNIKVKKEVIQKASVFINNCYEVLANDSEEEGEQTS